MVDRARFDIILRDSFSGPAKKAAGALSGVERGLQRIQQRERSQARAQLNRYGRDMAGAAGRNALWRFRFTDIGLAQLASAGANVVATFGQIAYSAQAAYLSVASFRQDSITSLETVLGNNAAAQRSFRNALVMANQTPLDPQDVIGTFTQFAVGGFGERELAPLTAAVADIQAARGNAAADSLTRVLTQIRGLGRVMRGDITMQGISAGLNAGDIFESIARQMNLGTGRAGIRAAEQAVSRGRVNDTIAIQAFLDSVQKRYDRGGALGTFARNQSATLTGALSNMRGAMFTLLGSADLTKTAGVGAVTNAVLALNSSLDMTSATGQRLRGVIIGASDAILTGLFGGITEGGIRGVMEDALSLAEGVVAVVRIGAPLVRSFVGGAGAGLRAGLYPVIASMRALGTVEGGRKLELLGVAFGYLGRAVGFFVGVVGSGVALVVSFTAATGALFGAAQAAGGALLGLLDTGTDAMADFGYSAAVGIVEGFERGLAETGGRMAGAVTGAFDGAVGAARTVLDWHSPSGVFRDAGEDVARGFALGVQGGAGLVASSVAGMLAPGGGASAAAAGGGRPTAHITINIPDRPDARSIAREVMAEIMSEFEVIALEGAPSQEEPANG